MPARPPATKLCPRTAPPPSTAALLAKGIAQFRLESAGFGMAKPIADNENEEDEAKNRQVKIVKR